MGYIMYIIGGINILLGFIFGILNADRHGFLLGFALTLVISLISASVFIALGKILFNQETLICLLKYPVSRSRIEVEQRSCVSCGKQYGVDRSSCPYCGFKEEVS